MSDEPEVDPTTVEITGHAHVTLPPLSLPELVERIKESQVGDVEPPRDDVVIG